MTVAYDATGTGGIGSNSGASISWSHTAANGAYVLVAVESETNASDPITGVTYGGVAMTNLSAIYNDNVSADGQLTLWGLANVVGGISTVTMTFPVSSFYVGNSVSYTGVGTVGSPSTAYGGGTSGLSQTLTGASSGGVLFCALGSSGRYYTSGSITGGTLRYANTGTTSRPALAIQDSTATGSITFQATTFSTTLWSGIGIILNPSAPISMTGHGQLVGQVNHAYPKLTAHGALSVATKQKFSRSVALSGRGKLTLVGIASSPLQGHGALSASAAATKFTFTAPLSGHSVLAAKPAQISPAALTGHGVLAAAAYAKFTEPVALPGAGTLSAVTRPKFAEPTPISGHGALSAIAKSTRPGRFSSHGVITVATLPIRATGVSLAGAGVLTVATTATRFSGSALTGAGVLSAAISSRIAATGTLSGSGVLSATRHATKFIIASTPNGTGVLSATATPKLTVTATLSSAGTLVAATRNLFPSLPGHGVLLAAAFGGTVTPYAATSIQTAIATATFTASLAKIDFWWGLAAILGPRINPTGYGALTGAATKKTFSSHGALSAAARMYSIRVPAALAGNGTASRS